MKNGEKAIFLTAPAGMFDSIETAKKCGNSLKAMLEYNYDKLNITGNPVLIGISNVDGNIAQYVEIKNGVGRPKRILQGDIENCFVDAHIHILIYGDKAEQVSSIIIDYLIKKSKKYGFDVGKLIWKEYLETDKDVARVEFYIERQSFSRLTVNRWYKYCQEGKLQNDNSIDDELFFDSFDECEVSEKLDLFEYLNDKQEDFDDNNESSYEIETYAEKASYKNNITQTEDTEYIIADLRIKWLCLQEFKKIAIDFIVNYELADNIVYLQNEIYFIANSLKNNLYEDYNYKIKNITLEIEKIRNIVYLQKQAYQLSLEESKYTNIENRYYYS